MYIYFWQQQKTSTESPICVLSISNLFNWTLKFCSPFLLMVTINFIKKEKPSVQEEYTNSKTTPKAPKRWRNIKTRRNTKTSTINNQISKDEKPPAQCPLLSKKISCAISTPVNVHKGDLKVLEKVPNFFHYIRVGFSWESTTETV